MPQMTPQVARLVPDLSCFIFRKRHRENREAISIVKPQLI